MKALFLALCIVGLVAASIACAWFPWWLAAPVSVVLGACLPLAAAHVQEQQRRQRQPLRPIPQPRTRPQARNGRLTYKLKL